MTTACSDRDSKFYGVGDMGSSPDGLIRPLLIYTRTMPSLDMLILRFITNARTNFGVCYDGVISEANDNENIFYKFYYFGSWLRRRIDIVREPVSIFF